MGRSNSITNLTVRPQAVADRGSAPAVMLGSMGAGFIVGHPLRGPRLLADESVEIGDSAGAGGLFGIVFDLLLALRLDGPQGLQIVERLNSGGRLAHEDDAAVAGLHQLPFGLFGGGERRGRGV